jgi:hypothetical protein
MTKRIKPTKPEMVRFRATPAQKAEFKRRGGAEAGREWLDNPTVDKLTPIEKKAPK